MADFRNNISNLLKEKDISIRKMSMDLGLEYSYTYDLVNRESLSTTHLATLNKVSKYLDVKIEELYKE